MKARTLSDDGTIVEKVLGGEVQSFAILVDRHQQSVRCMAANLLSNRSAADDVAQEVFLAAYLNLRSFNPRLATFSTWLLTICRNKCLNEIRRQCAAPLEGIPEPADPRRPADQLLEQELMAGLDRALVELPLEQRLAFVQAELLGLSCEEIARIEREPAGTIRSRLTRARMALRSALRQFAGDAP